MPEIGLFLSSEEHPATFLLESAKRAEQAGFRHVLVSDHYHPWLEEQGHSPFVWSVLGAIAASTDLTMTTGVTCPTVRIHPAILAQATATIAEMAPGRFRFGIGSGEALNEHILGDRWPITAVRLEMMEEAVTVIRKLWKGGMITHRGAHYTVEAARVYEAPAEPIPIIVSGFGPEAIDVAARTGDGFITVQPDPEAVERYRSAGGSGVLVGALKCCWGPDRDDAVALAHHRWRNDALPGELAQTLPAPAHFTQATQLVTPQMIGDSIPAGPDPGEYVQAIGAFADAGFDEVYVQHIGDDIAGFLDFFTTQVQPKLSV